MRDYTTLHSDTYWSKGTHCSKKGCGSKWIWETIQHYTQTQIEVKEQLVVRQNMDVTKHERLSNITLRHRLKSRNMRDYTTLHSDTDWSKGTTCSKKEYGCDWTWETIQHYTQTHIEVKEQLVVRQNMDVTKHERRSNITLRHRLKSMNMRDYTTLHSDTDWSQGTWETIQHYTQTQIEVKEQLVVRKNMDVTEHERLYNITLRHRLK